MFTLAQRRMFSPDIVESDAFLDMPVSSQALYFHLGMYADDDGFVGSPKRIMTTIGANGDDLKVLLTKRFLLSFENGVVVIKHWLIHNLIRADLYKETRYKTEKSKLGLNESGAYTELQNSISEIKKIGEPEWLTRRRGKRTANVPQTYRKRYLGKVRLGKVRLGKDNKRERLSPLKNSIKYLQEIPQEDVIDFTVNYVITEIEVKKKAEELFNYCKMHGKLYKDYKAFLRNAIAKDYKQRVILTETPLSDMIPD